MQNILIFIICALLVSGLGNTNVVYAQKSLVSDKNTPLNDLLLKNVQIKAESIEKLFAKFSIYYGIPIGLEVSSNDDSSSAYINFTEGKLSELLNQTISRHSQYTWEIRDGVVNIFPKDNYRDSAFKEMLETKIANFTVQEGSSCRLIEKLLTETPEIQKVTTTYGLSYESRDLSGFYISQLGKNFTVKISDMTLKSILNKIVKESPTARYWFIVRYNIDNQVFLLGLDAQAENQPKTNEKID